MGIENKKIGGRYLVLRRLGSGGMSDAVLLLDTRTGKQWAGKRIRLSGDAARDAVIIDSFKTEYEVVRSLDHPALPRFADMVESEDGLFIIMDYIEGLSLSEVVHRGGAQSQEDVIEWGCMLCDVLDYLHTRTQPIVCCNLKPSDIMITTDSQIKLIDLGIARRLLGERQQRKEGNVAFIGRSSASLPPMSWTPSEEGVSAGGARALKTSGYAAPERAENLGRADARSDVYALGAILRHLLTGQSPSEAGFPLSPITQVDSSLSLGLEAVLLKACSPDPADRYQSCAEMQYALKNHKKEAKPYRIRLKRRLFLFRAVCAAAVAFALVGAGVLIYRNQAISSDYDYALELASESATAEEAQQHYLAAIEIEPMSSQAYLGLIDAYRQDGVLTTEEEAQIRVPLQAHLSQLRTHEAEFAPVAYELGIAYWCNYTFGDEGADESVTRMRAAQPWFAYAARAENFEFASRAKIYEGIASFNTAIVPKIEQGTDAGEYAPYGEKLAALLSEVSQESNEVMRLDVAALVDTALSTYSRKFRNDGVSAETLEGIREQALDLVSDTQTTSTITDGRKAQLLQSLENDKTFVAEAFMD